MNKTIFLTSFFAMTCAFLFGQGTTDVKFGKNRIQYHQDFEKWSQYESDNFVTYWYGQGRNIGQAAVVLAEYDFKEIQNFLEFRMNDKLEIIIYSDLTDLKQSNIGLEEAFENTGGQTKIVENKIFIYFNGDHNHLRRQIREGIASVYLNAMLFGSNLQEIVQNAVLLNLPEWFKLGMVAYVGEHWSTSMDNELKAYFEANEEIDFIKFGEDHPELAGHALWYYLGLMFGDDSVSNLLYYTRIYRNIESGFAYVLGSSFEKTILSWENYFRQRYRGDLKGKGEPLGEEIQIKNRFNAPISQIKISPTGQQIALVLNEIGKVKVQLYDLRKEEQKTIFKTGFRNAFQATDYNYPLIAWNAVGSELAILYEKQDQPKLLRYNTRQDKSVEDELGIALQRVYSMDYVDNGTMLFSAATRGYSDLFLYFINARQVRAITNDHYDDLDARIIRYGDKRGIIWASNRPNTKLQTVKLDTLPAITPLDIFYYDYDKNDKEAVRVTNTPYANERQPMGIGTTHFSFLTDETGIYNRKVGYLEEYIAYYEKIVELTDGSEIVMHIDSTLEKLDSTLIDTVFTRPIVKQRAINHYVTNYNYGIEAQAQAARVNKYVELIKEGEDYFIFVDTLSVNSMAYPAATYHRLAVARQDSLLSIPEQVVEPKVSEQYEIQLPTKITPPEEEKEEEEEESSYFFVSEFEEEEEEKQAAPATPKETEQSAPTTPEVVETTPTIEEVTIPSFEPIEPVNQQSEEQEGVSNVHDFKPGRIISHRLRFRADIVTWQMDNTQLFGGLNAFNQVQGGQGGFNTGVPADFAYPPPGILFKATFTDLFEDYQIEAGVRVPTSFNGTEIFINVDDNKKRFDKRYSLYRRSLRFDGGNAIAFGPRRIESQILAGTFELKYPIDIYRSLRLKSTLRMDTDVPLASDSIILDFPINRQQRIGLGLEYVFDNTLDVAINIKHGTRYKIYAEAVKRFSLDLDNGAELEVNDGFMTILGLDFRHYQRLDKKSIFAIRVAGATTFGAERILYRLGGVESWLFPNFNQDIPQPTEGNFAYTANATNLRGFPLNIRNGSSYAVINNELRVPLFRYLSKNPKPFFRNFQVIGFFDIGTAWTGTSPFIEDNPINTSTFSNGPVEVKVNYFRDPIVAGYGYGLRAVLFGYFLRLDRAWGIETRVVQDPRWYISIGTDF